MPGKSRHNYRHLPAFILLVLAERPAHGGAIHSLLNKSLPHFQSDTGAVYRSLQHLETEASVTSVWDTTEAGPARKIYHITPSGWDRLDEWRQDMEKRMANLKYFLTTYRELKEKKN